MIKLSTTNSRADALAPALNHQPSSRNGVLGPASLAEMCSRPELDLSSAFRLPGLGDLPLDHLPSSLLTPPVSSEQPATLIDTKPVQRRKFRRHGHVASLPAVQRDMVNRMLYNGVPYKNIVAALDEAGYTVTERNISNWATGGFLEWRLVHEQVIENRLDQDLLLDFLRRDDAPELPEIGLQAAATRLSQVMLQKLTSGEDPEAHLDNYAKLVELLCRLNREIAATQKQRDNSRRVLGPEYDPARVKETEQLNALDFERHFTNPPADSALPKPAVPMPLPPISTSAFLVRQAKEDRQEAEIQSKKRGLEMLRIMEARLRAKSTQTQSAPLTASNKPASPPPTPNAAVKTAAPSPSPTSEPKPTEAAG